MSAMNLAGMDTFRKAVLTHPQGPSVQRTAVWWAGLNKTEAEDVLDWLEGNAYPRSALRHEAGKGFVVLSCEGIRSAA
jgi:hypothetical protein